MTGIIHPVKAADIPHSPYVGKDDIFFLFDVTQIDGVYQLDAAPEAPIAINKPELRTAIADNTGIVLPLRTEISKGNIPDAVRQSWPQIDWSRMYTGATGAIPHVTSPDDNQTRILLMQNSLDKPVNPGKWNFPSGLISSRHPVETAFLELNEESGLFLVYPDKLIGINMRLPADLPALSQEFQNGAFAARNAQEANIRKQLATHHPEHAEKPIEWTTIQTHKMDIPTAILDTVSVSILEQRYNAIAHVIKDDAAHSVNIHYPVDITKGLNSRNFNLIAVDPEKFGRNAKLVTLTEALALETIPAPSDYKARIAASGGFYPTLDMDR